MFDTENHSSCTCDNKKITSQTESYNMIENLDWYLSPVYQKDGH